MTRKHQNGSFMVLGALAISTMIAVLGLMVDMSWVYSSRMQLRNAADALAVIGAKKLIKENMLVATTEVINTAGQFKIGEKNLQLNSSDIRFGKYDASTEIFTETSVKADTIEVSARRTASSQSGALPLFFSPAFGKKTMDISCKSYSSVSTLDLLLVTDISGSMDDDTTTIVTRGRNGRTQRLPGVPQPITAAKDAAMSFLDFLRDDCDRAGFISYADTASLRKILTYDYDAVADAIDGVNANGWTNIGAAIQTARQEYSNHGRQISAKVILLLSDGQPNCKTLDGTCGDNYEYQGENYARTQAQLAAADGIIIYAISLGSGANRSLMQHMANITGGKEYYAPTGAELQDVYNQIVTELPVKLVG